MIPSPARATALLLLPLLAVVAACQSSGPSEFPDQNRSLHGELQVLLDSVAAVDEPPRDALTLLSSLVDGTYAGQTVVGVQEFGGSIEAIEIYRKQSLKKQTSRVRSLWKTVSGGKKSRIKIIRKTDPAKAAKQTAELDREDALFGQVEESVEPLLVQLEEIETALENAHLVAELDFSPTALEDLAPDVARIGALIDALGAPAATMTARTETFQAEFEPFVVEPAGGATEAGAAPGNAVDGDQTP